MGFSAEHANREYLKCCKYQGKDTNQPHKAEDDEENCIQSMNSPCLQEVVMNNHQLDSCLT